MRPAGDVFEESEDVQLTSTGAISTLSRDGACKRPPREFWIGFHVAAPGPSYDEAPKRRARKQPSPRGKRPLKGS